MAQLDFGQLHASALALYALNEIIIFSISYVVALKLFKRERLESFLLAMAMIFVNSLLYVWPISFLIYGEAAALPITAIVAWDASVAFSFFIISMELMSGKSANPTRAILRNPVLIAIVLGTFASLAAIAVPTPILTFMEFTLNSAGPSGAMAFSLALLYGVRTDAIAQVIIWTSVLSLFSLAYLA